MKPNFKLIVVTLFISFYILPLSAIEILPKVIIVTTGGTVAMKYDSTTGGVVPAVSGKDLIAAVSGIDKIANLEIVEFCNIDSSQMTPKLWRDLSKKVKSILSRTDVNGVVVTHGTDTMADAAFFLETVLDSKKPVVFVGAMRSASDLSPDGPANIYNAVIQVTSPNAQKWGVTLTMNQYINSARYVKKTNTTNIQTFNSGEYGYLGYIVDGKVVKFNSIKRKEKLTIPIKIPLVRIFTTYAGDDAKPIRESIDNGVDGLVIEGVGAGNVNKEVFLAIKYAINKKVPVVVSSRVPNGAVYALYGDEGGGSSLVKAGAFLAGNLTTEKARLLLLIALAQPDITQKKLKKLFERD